MNLSSLRRPFLPAIALVLSLAAPATARPFLTDEVAPLGRFAFETGFTGSFRTDRFKDPETDYETVTLPFHMNLGITRTVDLGFRLTYLSQTLDTGSSKFTGSRAAAFSPEIKISPSQYAGIKFIWHAAIGAESDQELPVERGDDYELKALFALPGRLPLLLNVGKVWKSGYSSDQGVQGQREFDIEPGDIFEASLALEMPVKWGISIIGEGAYYTVSERMVDGLKLTGSDGEAADASIGLNWRHKGWDMGTAVSFGLLDESHTSFDLERGSGDITYRWQLHYRLQPHKAVSYE